MEKPAAAAPQLLEAVRKFFNEQIPFNRYLDLQLEAIERGRAVVRVPFRPEYVGDVTKSIVHGGVLSALIDVTGGATAFTVLDFPREVGINTIDMRVDYVRPGMGELFRAVGSVVRKGSRICVVRMEVHNDAGALVALGTAAYSILAGDRRGGSAMYQMLRGLASGGPAGEAHDVAGEMLPGADPAEQAHRRS